MLPEGPVRWLVVANITWIAAGVLAFATPTAMPILTCMVLVIAMVGILRTRDELDDDAEQWLDRALSAVTGTWGVLAVLILLPYVGLDEGSLWGSRTFVLMSLALASLGMLAWNALAYQGRAQWDAVRAVRTYSLFHLAVLAVALYIGLGDGAAQLIAIRGVETTRVDLQWAPLIASLPGIVWAMALARTD